MKNEEPKQSREQATDPDDNQNVSPTVTQSPTKDAATIKKLQSQNDVLRDELKVLNEKLSEVLERQKLKKTEKRIVTESSEVETLKKELENANHQIKGYQKEVGSLKNKLTSVTTGDKLTAMENAMREKDRRIHELEFETKTLSKIKTEQEKTIQTLSSDKEYQEKMNRMMEDIRGMREKNREMVEKARKDEKNYKKQQEFLVVLETRYREVCEKHGVSPSLNFTKVDEMEKSNTQASKSLPSIKRVAPKPTTTPGAQQNGTINQNSKTKLPPNQPEEKKKEDTIEMSPDRFTQLQEQLNIMTNSKKSTERKLKGEIAQLTTKVGVLEAEVAEVTKQLRDKEKENNILQLKVNEMKRAEKQRKAEQQQLQASNVTNLMSNASPGLPPIQDKGMTERNGAQDQNKPTPKPETPAQKPSSRARGQQPAQEKKDETARRDKKGAEESGDIAWDDGAKLKNEAHIKINKLTIYYQNDFIYGIQANYIKGNGEVIEGEPHVSMDRKEKYLVKALAFEPDDYITSISGIHSKAVQYLEILTKKGGKHEIGNSTKNEGSADFKVDIGENEHPRVLLGAMTTLKEGENSDLVLSQIGAEMEKYLPEDFPALHK